jgi:hypothetical protein
MATAQPVLHTVGRVGAAGPRDGNADAGVLRLDQVEIEEQGATRDRGVPFDRDVLLDPQRELAGGIGVADQDSLVGGSRYRGENGDEGNEGDLFHASIVYEFDHRNLSGL